MVSRCFIVALSLLVIMTAEPCLAAWFYLPGIEPVQYADGKNVAVKVNTLRSINTLMPKSYYSAPFCRPSDTVLDAGRRSESLGEVLWGDDIEMSMYTVQMRKNVSCVRLNCPADQTKMDQSKLSLFAKLIEDEYRGHMIIDNLPGFNPGTLTYGGKCKDGDRWDNMRGYPLGVQKSCAGDTLINNHLEFTIEYHLPDDANPKKPEYRVVGFNVVAHSFKHSESSCDANFNVYADHEPVSATDLAKTPSIVWSYGVKWVENKNVRWTTRWDAYLNTSFSNSNANVHWGAIIKSLLIVVFLAGVITAIMMRTLHRDFNRYNNPDNLEEGQEEVGWKMIHADVFRAPSYAGLFTITIGTGVQLLTMCGLTLFFSLLGFLSPANRGGLLTTLVLLYTLQSFFAGYTTSRLLKMFDLKSWATVFGTGLLFPGFMAFLYFVADLILWHNNAANAVPFTTILTLDGLWWLVSLPLVVLGASVGFRRPLEDSPRKVNKLCRYIPDQYWYHAPPFTYIVPGFIPFGVTLLELGFIFSSLWQGMVYYAFGFLTTVFILWIVTTALTTILFVYYQLCYEDWRWWWRSFFVPGGSGMHFFLFGVYYYSTQLTLKSGTTSLLYFIYLGMASIAYGLTVGTVGFAASWLFVRKIYSALHID